MARPVEYIRSWVPARAGEYVTLRYVRGLPVRCRFGAGGCGGSARELLAASVNERNAGRDVV